MSDEEVKEETPEEAGYDNIASPRASVMDGVAGMSLSQPPDAQQPPAQDMNNTPFARALTTAPPPQPLSQTAKDQLTQGHTFLKHGARGKPKERTVFLQVDLGRISWKPSRSIHKAGIQLSDVREMRTGLSTPSLLRGLCGEGSEDRTFSLVSKKRTLDLEAQSQQERDTWMNLFHAAMEDIKLRPRKETDGIKYRRNQLFIDVDEFVNMTISREGTVVECGVDGRVVFKSEITGMPTCDFYFNDVNSVKANPNEAVHLSDIVFHPCVELPRWKAQGTIVFTPPDGEFELMRYRTRGNVNLPLTFEHNLASLGATSEKNGRVFIKNAFTPGSGARSIVLSCRIPLDCKVTDTKATMGKVVMDEVRHLVIWRISKWAHGGSADAILRIHVEPNPSPPPPPRVEEPLLAIQFDVLRFAASNMKVRACRVNSSEKIEVMKWIKYNTSAGKVTDLGNEAPAAPVLTEPIPAMPEMPTAGGDSMSMPSGEGFM